MAIKWSPGCPCCGGGEPPGCLCGDTIWEWDDNAQEWNIFQNACTGFCIPVKPAFDGTADREQFTTCCICPECAGATWEWKVAKFSAYVSNSGYINCPPPEVGGGCTGFHGSELNRSFRYTNDGLGNEQIESLGQVVNGNTFDFPGKYDQDGQLWPITWRMYISVSQFGAGWSLSRQDLRYGDPTFYPYDGISNVPQGKRSRLLKCGDPPVNPCFGYDYWPQLTEWEFCGAPYGTCCGYEGEGSWFILDDACVAPCIYTKPERAGLFDGEQLTTCCTCSECGGSYWEWDGLSAWVLLADSCVDPCTAVPPTRPGSFTCERTIICCEPGVAATKAIEAKTMSGPGTELKALIPNLFKKKGCGCNDYAKKMDAWGPDGCEQRFDSIVAHLMQQAKQHLATRLIPEGITKRQAEKWVRQAIENSRK